MSLLVVLLLAVSGCATETSRLQQLKDEGLRLAKQVNFSSSPEAKLRVAEEVLAHASLYDQLISRSPDIPYMTKAQRFQRQEREAAAVLMREAASDYANRHDLARARAVYQGILTSFPEQDYQPIRRAAESSLKQLNEVEQEPK